MERLERLGRSLSVLTGRKVGPEFCLLHFRHSNSAYRNLLGERGVNETVVFGVLSSLAFDTILHCRMPSSTVPMPNCGLAA